MADLILRQNLADGSVPRGIALNGVAATTETEAVVAEISWRFEDDPDMEFQPLGETTAGSKLNVPYFDGQNRDIRFSLISKSSDGVSSRGLAKEAIQTSIPTTGSSLTSHTEYFMEENQANTNAGFAAAITAINLAGVPTTLVLTEDISLTASHTLPATCKLAIRNNAVITMSGSSTLTIGSFEDPGHVQCFAGVSPSRCTAGTLLVTVPRKRTFSSNTPNPD